MAPLLLFDSVGPVVILSLLIKITKPQSLPCLVTPLYLLGLSLLCSKIPKTTHYSHKYYVFVVCCGQGAMIASVVAVGRVL